MKLLMTDPRTDGYFFASVGNFLVYRELDKAFSSVAKNT